MCDGDNIAQWISPVLVCIESTSFFLICRIEKYIYCYDSVWNGEEPCISSMLDSFWSGFSFCMKAGKKFKLLLLFLPLLSLWCIFMNTEISRRDKHGHQRSLSFSAHGDSTTKGSQAREAQYFCLSAWALWMKFHPNMKFFMFNN